MEQQKHNTGWQALIDFQNQDSDYHFSKALDVPNLNLASANLLHFFEMFPVKSSKNTKLFLVVGGYLTSEVFLKGVTVAAIAEWVGVSIPFGSGQFETPDTKHQWIEKIFLTAVALR